LNVLVAAAEERRPVVLVAHSLGSLISYSVLLNHTPYPSISSFDVLRLITVGSMLALPRIGSALLGSHQGSITLVPASVRSWINIRNRRDPLAFALTTVSSADPRKRPVELVINNSRAHTSAHSIVNYLTDTLAIRAILSGWCQGFVAAPPPPACGNVRDVP
jgi:alpha-beta hydrolase superfamily lysophospholipase